MVDPLPLLNSQPHFSDTSIMFNLIFLCSSSKFSLHGSELQPSDQFTNPLPSIILTPVATGNEKVVPLTTVRAARAAVDAHHDAKK